MGFKDNFKSKNEQLHLRLFSGAKTKIPELQLE